MNPGSRLEYRDTDNDESGSEPSPSQRDANPSVTIQGKAYPKKAQIGKKKKSFKKKKKK